MLSSQDYYPFGMAMTERSYTESQETKYRYGFNTQERDDDIDEGGSHYTAEFWEYDGRTGRRWNVDPKPNVEISVYACFANNPIMFSDVKGDTLRFSGRPEFVAKMNDILTNLRCMSSFVDIMLTQLENSKNIHTIVEARSLEGERGTLVFQESVKWRKEAIKNHVSEHIWNGTKIPEVLVDARRIGNYSDTDGTGCGSNLFFCLYLWEQDKSPIVSHGCFTMYTTLGHELFHMFKADLGKMLSRAGINPEELNTVHGENIIAYELNKFSMEGGGTEEITYRQKYGYNDPDNALCDNQYAEFSKYFKDYFKSKKDIKKIDLNFSENEEQ